MNTLEGHTDPRTVRYHSRPLTTQPGRSILMRGRVTVLFVHDAEDEADIQAHPERWHAAGTPDKVTIYERERESRS